MSVRYNSLLGAYVITHDKKDYTVKEILADYRADASIGRATRVALAQPSIEEPVVFTEVWADIRRKRESDIQSAVLDDLKAHFGDDDVQFQKFEGMFFTILNARDLCLSNGNRDDTLYLTARNGRPLDLSSVASLGIKGGYEPKSGADIDSSVRLPNSAGFYDSHSPLEG